MKSYSNSLALCVAFFMVCSIAGVSAQQAEPVQQPQQGEPSQLPQQPAPSQKDSLTLAGEWRGTLKVGASSLRIVFHIVDSGTGYVATMDSPDQGARGIPVSGVRIEGKGVVIEVASVGGSYTGTLDAVGNQLEGFWNQSGISFPLTLSRQPSAEIHTEQKSMPMKEPASLAYRVKEVRFNGGAEEVQLAGTLTLPKVNGPFPAVVLVSGSGPQNRDEEILGHKPFFIIADYLTQRGIAVLRCDDRGVGASTGDYQAATTFDFAADAQAAIDFLARQEGIDENNIGIIGHSEGAIIASILAAREEISWDGWASANGAGHEDTCDTCGAAGFNETRESSRPAFIVLLAGPGVQGYELLLMQNEAIGRASGLSGEQIIEANNLNRKLYDIVIEERDEQLLRKKLTDVFYEEIDLNPVLSPLDKEAQKAQVPQVIAPLLSPWIRTFLELDPADYLRKVKVPVLALNGSKDLQVPCKSNLEAIRSALSEAGNNSSTFVELEGLNHLFQHATTGLPSEYSEIEEDFAPEALQIMGDWILNIISP